MLSLLWKKKPAQPKSPEEQWLSVLNKVNNWHCNDSIPSLFGTSYTLRGSIKNSKGNYGYDGYDVVKLESAIDWKTMHAAPKGMPVQQPAPRIFTLSIETTESILVIPFPEVTEASQQMLKAFMEPKINAFLQKQEELKREEALKPIKQKQEVISRLLK